MSFEVHTFEDEAYPSSAAAAIATRWLPRGSVVITGGTTAARIYPALANQDLDWSGAQVFFSDERCVPPDDDASNYKMAHELLLSSVTADVHRMRGEEEPGAAADEYHRAVLPAVDHGLSLALLGMGADNHIAGLFPGSGGLDETARLCMAVDRPDGMKGLTLTPPALLSAAVILLLVTGRAKSAAVARALQGKGDVAGCPVLLLAHHPDVTFLLDRDAASSL